MAVKSWDYGCDQPERVRPRVDHPEGEQERVGDQALELAFIMGDLVFLQNFAWERLFLDLQLQLRCTNTPLVFTTCPSSAL